MAKKYDTPKIEELIDAGVHFGHQVKRWHPSMEPYIYTVKRNIHIIDLEVTEDLLKKAADFLYSVARKGGKIVFVGTKKQARDIVEIEAKRAGAMFVTERWLGGTVTNFDVIKKNNIDKLIKMKKQREEGGFEKYTKKERLLLDRKIEKLDRFVGGLIGLSKIPDAVFVIDARRERTAVREAVVAKVPVIALIDTNSDPSDIAYPIPGNDDAIKSIACVVKALSDAVESGYSDFATGVREEQEQKKEIEKKEAKEKEAKEKDTKVGEAKKEEKKEEKKKEEKKKEKPPAKKEGKPKKATTEKVTTEKTTKKEPAKKRGRPKKSNKEKK